MAEWVGIMGGWVARRLSDRMQTRTLWSMVKPKWPNRWEREGSSVNNGKNKMVKMMYKMELLISQFKYAITYAFIHQTRRLRVFLFIQQLL